MVSEKYSAGPNFKANRKGGAAGQTDPDCTGNKEPIAAILTQLRPVPLAIW